MTALTQASYATLMPAAYDQGLLDKLLPIIAKANPQLLASGLYYLAVSPEDEVVGAGGWTRERPGSGDTEAGLGHIRHFATHPDWTGQGVGRALFERCLSESRSTGISWFECYSSLNAVDFYRRLGFLEVRTIDIPMGGDLVMPAVLMEQRL